MNAEEEEAGMRMVEEEKKPEILRIATSPHM
jgi:hypothetical protein